MQVEKNFKSQFGNHAKAAHESVAAFQWVLADNGGLGLVEAAKEAVDFWANKVRKDSKDKTLPEWMAWANALRDSLNGLYAFVKEHYKQGITYNGKGGDFPAPGAAAPAAAAPAPAAAAPVAAAPAPAAAAPATNGASTPAAGGARPNLASMFSQISSIDQSSGRTAGLKHVDKKAVAAEKAAGAPVTPAAPTPKREWNGGHSLMGAANRGRGHCDLSLAPYHLFPLRSPPIPALPCSRRGGPRAPRGGRDPVWRAEGGVRERAALEG